MTALYFFDKSLNLLDDGIFEPLEQVSSWQKAALNGLITHDVEVVNREALEVAEYFGTNDVDAENVFHIYKIISRKKKGATTEFSGIHKFFDDLKAISYVKDYRPTDKNLGEVAQTIFSGTGWEVGNNSVSRLASASFYYQSKLHAFWTILEAFSAEFRLRIEYSDGRIVRQLVDFNNRFAEDNGVWYEYGDKLLSVEAETSSEGIYTALVGRGKGVAVEGDSGEISGYGRRVLFDSVAWSTANGKPVNKPMGQDYVELPSATSLYGYPDGSARFGIVEFPEIEEPEELLQATYNALVETARPKVQLSASVFENERRALGEVVAIVRDDIGIRYKTRIFETETNFLSRSALKTIRFGDKLVYTTAERQIQATATAKKEAQATQSYIDSVRALITTDFASSDGYNYDLEAGNPYGLPAGIYSFDKPIDENPTEVIGISAGKLVIANSKTSTGAWIWSTFGTGDGFTADLITAGTIEGGSSYWNLETGEINIGGLSYSPGTGLRVSSETTVGSTGKTLGQIAEIEVGGRNLALLSNDAIKTDSHLIKHYNLSTKLRTGETYTATIWGQLGAGKYGFRIFLNNGSTPIVTLLAESQDNGKYTVTFENTTPESDFDADSIIVYALYDTVTVASTIEKIKLERGNTPTDWTPAPEDAQESIAAGLSESLAAAEDALAQANAEAERLATEISEATADGKISAEEEARIAAIDEVLTAAKNYAEEQATIAEDAAKAYVDKRPIEGWFDVVGGRATFGEKGSPYGLVMDNDEIFFTIAGQIVSRWSLNDFEVPRIKAASGVFGNWTVGETDDGFFGIR